MKNRAVRTVSFPSGKETLAGTLYPATSDELRTAAGHPVVVMAHGLSMTRDSGLAPYAERFAAAGITTLVFDYRYFGDSTGSPRELVSAHRQVEDYHAALRYARSLPDVDAERVGLWGTSYSGGVALQCAYEDGKHRALVIQVPNLDNAYTGAFMFWQLARKAPVRGLWLASRAVMDFAAGLVGLPAVYTTAMGHDGDWAAYTNDESLGYIDQIRGPAWKNRIALRDFIRLPIFRPVVHASKLRAPVMIVTAERDDLTPLGPVLRAAKLAGDKAELHRRDVTHFQVYTGELFEDLVSKEVAFLKRNLAAHAQRETTRSAAVD